MQNDVNKLESEILKTIEEYKVKPTEIDDTTLELNYGMYRAYIRNMPELVADKYQTICEFMHDTYYKDKYT